MASLKIGCVDTASNKVILDLNFMSSGEPRMSVIDLPRAAIKRRVHSTKRFPSTLFSG